MEGRKKIFILIGLLILVVITLLALTLKQTAKPISTIPQPSEATASNLEIVSIHPQQDPLGNQGYPPTQPVIFFFNKGLNLKTLLYKVEPPLETETAYDETINKLTIKPQGTNFWTPGTTYTITLQRGTQATDSGTLKEDYVYQLKTVLQGGE